MYAVKCDVTKEEEIIKGFKWVHQHLGPANILINNAGVAKPTNLIGKEVKKYKIIF